MKDVIIIGSGMGALSAGAVLAKNGWKVHLLEQNWIPGGCTTSYPRKNYVFEAGATTIVGMDDHMPLKHLLDYTGIKIPMRKLEVPMKVYLDDQTLVKHQSIEEWITTASKHFEGDQAGFWRLAYKISQFVWKASLNYLSFPPSNFSDLLDMIRHVNFSDIFPARYALISTSSMMKKYGVDQPDFQRYVNEQLMITAQNKADEVNFLFGAAALCYTNYQNFYIDGGLRNLVNPFIKYIEEKGGSITYRDPVTSVTKSNDGYTVTTKSNSYHTKKLISGIPLNNTLDLFKDDFRKGKQKILRSSKLNSAFQMGIAFKSDQIFDCLHHQIHLSEPLPGIEASSIFVSLSHPKDDTRAPEKDVIIASVSTHWPDPENKKFESKTLEKQIIKLLETRGFLKQEAILYQHSSGPKSWQKWTGRKWGFVGGYPQFMDIKPWQLNDCRIDHSGAYLVGDSAYPGQGIPGVTLGGIIAAHKLIRDDASN